MVTTSCQNAISYFVGERKRVVERWSNINIYITRPAELLCSTFFFQMAYPSYLYIVNLNDFVLRWRVFSFVCQVCRKGGGSASETLPTAEFNLLVFSKKKSFFGFFFSCAFAIRTKNNADEPQIERWCL